MKLLFDQNISYKVVDKIDKEFEGSRHVLTLGLEHKRDIEIIEFAKENNFSIVTKDRDFFEYISYSGAPPKIIWIRTGNTSTSNIINLFEYHMETIKRFLLNDRKDILEID